jgi:DNA-binding response OmpR family regulator
MHLTDRTEGARTALPTVLIVDDDEMARAMAKSLLKRAGIVNRMALADSADSAKRCLQSLKNGGVASRPGLVLLDITLPDQSGFSVLEWIRQRRGLHSVRVIIWSASRDDRDRARASELGADAFFEKYPTSLEFGRVVSACLGAAQTFM